MLRRKGGVTRLRLKPADDLAWQCEHAGFKPEREYRFHAVRKWRFDLAFPDRRLAVEVDGGGWIHGRHHRPLGYERDCEKGAWALICNWRVLHVTPGQVRSGAALAWIEALLKP